MTEGVQIVIYPVNDLAAAKARFTALLGVEPYADAPYYVGYKVAGQDIGLDPNGHRAGAVGYVAVAVTDIKARLQSLLDAGAEVNEALNDVGNGRLIASVKDPDGNLIGLVQDPA
jgi:predicted enzyme related to lactoylglutathione lyase